MRAIPDAGLAPPQRRRSALSWAMRTRTPALCRVKGFATATRDDTERQSSQLGSTRRAVSEDARIPDRAIDGRELRTAGVGRRAAGTERPRCCRSGPIETFAR